MTDVRNDVARGVVEALPQLSHEELVRYSRHLVLPDVGPEGQRRLKLARVLIIGAGGLGSPAALYLAAAGVGAIGLVDSDEVDATNLHRQILHGTSGVGSRKVASARERLEDLNPHVDVDVFPVRLTASNALEIIDGFDLVVDGSDNFPTRYLINDACVLTGRTNVYGAIFRFEGQASVFGAPGGPCYRCLFSEPPPPGLVPTCAEAGVVGALPGVIGSIQALEAIKLILGSEDTLVGRLLLFDGLKLTFRQLNVRKDPACPVCGPNPTVRELIDYDEFCGAAAATDEQLETTAPVLARERDTNPDLTVVDVREPHEWEICHIEGAQLIPLGELPYRLNELEGHRDIVTYCHHGIRSMQAVEILRSAGFPRVRSLRGGIEEWAVEVEPGMARY